jgi:hypothetical protein
MPGTHIVKEEIFTHQYLWSSSTALAKLVESEEDDSHQLIIPTLVTTVMAFEAFVNFCGMALLPELWANEREEFRGQGIDGKLVAIAKALSRFDFQKGHDPYQSIKKLFGFRDLVAHGKVYANTYEIHQIKGASPFNWEHPWDSYLTRKAIVKARSDVKSFCQCLVIAMRHEPNHHLLLHHDAFRWASCKRK